MATELGPIRLPKYRLHKASGRAIIEFRPIYGEKRKYLPGRFNSPESLQAYRRECAAIEKWKADRLGGAVSQLVMANLRDAETELSPREFSKRKFAAQLLDSLSDVRCADFGPVMLREVVQTMVAKGWCRSTINTYLHHIKQVFQWGAEKGLYGRIMYRNLLTVEALRKGETSAPETGQIQPVLWTVVKQVLPHVSRVVRDMIKLQYLTGMQSTQITALLDSEIDRTCKVWVYRPLKNQTSRSGIDAITCFGRRARRILERYLHRQGYLFSPRLADKQQKAKRAANRKTKLYGQAKGRRRSDRALRERYDSHSYFNAIKNGFRRLAAEKGYEPAKKRMKMNRAHAQAAGIEWWSPDQLRYARLVRTADGADQSRKPR
jgi:site-specific recombinase XerD